MDSIAPQNPDGYTPPPPELLHAASEWIWRHSRQPDGDRWLSPRPTVTAGNDPNHLDWAAENLLCDLAPWISAQAEDFRAALRVASESADRFRDNLAEALGHRDENPGDDVLIRELREHFGKTGPEPMRWRNFLTGARAQLDQIEAMPDPLRRAAGGDA